MISTDGNSQAWSDRQHDLYGEALVHGQEAYDKLYNAGLGSPQGGMTL